MSRVRISTNERASSDDVVQLQDLNLRAVMESIIGAHTGVGGAIPTVAPRGMVFAGLDITLGATTFDIASGCAMQRSATAPAAPRTYESSARLGFNTVPTTGVAFAGDGWNLVECQVADNVTLTTFRDILTAGVPTPTSVPKIEERQLTFRARLGTVSELPVRDLDWIPLYGVQVVAGAPVGGSEIDLRPLASMLDNGNFNGVGNVAISRRMNIVPNTTTSLGDEIEFDFVAVVDGCKVHATTLAPVNVDSIIAGAGFAPIDDVWYAIGIGTLQWGVSGEETPIAPTNLYGSNVVSRGVLAIRQVVQSGTPNFLNTFNPSVSQNVNNIVQGFDPNLLTRGFMTMCYLRRSAGQWRVFFQTKAGVCEMMTPITFDTVTSASPTDNDIALDNAAPTLQLAPPHVDLRMRLQRVAGIGPSGLVQYFYGVGPGYSAAQLARVHVCDLSQTITSGEQVWLNASRHRTITRRQVPVVSVGNNGGATLLIQITGFRF